MDGLSLEHSATGDESTAHRDKWQRRNWAVVGDESQVVSLQSANEYVVRPAEARGARRDRVKDWLHIGWRPTDHAQDLARGRLLLQRLARLGIGSCERLVLL